MPDTLTPELTNKQAAAAILREHRKAIKRWFDVTQRMTLVNACACGLIPAGRQKAIDRLCKQVRQQAR